MTIGKYSDATVPMKTIPKEWFEMAARVAKAMSEAGNEVVKDMPPEVFEISLAVLVSGTMNWNAAISEEEQEDLEEHFFENVRNMRGCIVPRPPN